MAVWHDALRALRWRGGAFSQRKSWRGVILSSGNVDGVALMSMLAINVAVVRQAVTMGGMTFNSGMVLLSGGDVR